MRRTVVAGVVAVLLLAACGGDNEPEGPAGTVPQGIPTTTDPYAVPAVIDEAYVNRVLAGLDHALGEVTRFVIRERAIQPEAIDRLRALYVGDFLELTIASYDRDIQNDFDGYRDEPGDRMTSLTRIMTASHSCIFAEVARDYSAASSRPARPARTEWIAITPSPAEARSAYNPTKWMFVFDGYGQGGVEPPNPCDAAS